MQRSFWRRFGPWIAFLIAATAYYPRFVSKPGGIFLYSHAASCLLHEQVLPQCDLRFTYPPAFALLMTPFVLLPPVGQLIVWYVISLACAVVCCELSTRIALRFIPGSWTARDIAWLRILGVLLSLKFILAVYETQSYDLLMLPAILLGVIALMDENDVGAGAAFGIAAALKVTPLLFLPYLIVRRRFLAAAVFVLVLGAVSISQDLILTPQGGAHSYLVTWLRDVAGASVFEHSAGSQLPFWDGVNIYNLSLRGALARLVDGTPYQPDFLIILRATQIAFIGLIGLLVLYAMRLEALVPVEVSLLIIAMLMLSPMTSRTHFVNLMLPYYLLTAAWLKDATTKRLGAAVLILSFIGCTGIPRDLVPRSFTEFMRDHNDIMLGTLVLIVYLAVVIRFPQRWGIGSRSADSTAAPAPQ